MKRPMMTSILMSRQIMTRTNRRQPEGMIRNFECYLQHLAALERSRLHAVRLRHGFAAICNTFSILRGGVEPFWFQTGCLAWAACSIEHAALARRPFWAPKGRNREARRAEHSQIWRSEGPKSAFRVGEVLENAPRAGESTKRA